MWSEEIITEPAAEPVDLATVKTHCRVDHNADDAYLSGLISAARAYCEEQTGLALLTQQWNFWRQDWPHKTPDMLLLPRAPLVSIDTFEYTDLTETTTVVDPTIYTVRLRKRSPAGIVLKFGKIWPPVVLSGNTPIHVAYTAGWTDATQVPQKIKLAIMLLVGHYYDNRVAVTVGKIAAVGSKELALGVDSLLAEYRFNQIGFD